MFPSGILQAGDSWHPDDCSVCHCDSGETVCYQKHCPVCPSGSVSVSVPGECCGKCQIGKLSYPSTIQNCGKNTLKVFMF